MIVVDQLKKKLKSCTISDQGYFGPEISISDKKNLAAICLQLKSDDAFQLDTLEDYTALDQGDTFGLVLHLRSAQDCLKLAIIKCDVSKKEAVVDTLSTIYGSAEWYEREIYDMFGIAFNAHPDLRRILLPDDWQGHPLLKDYEDEKLLKRP